MIYSCSYIMQRRLHPADFLFKGERAFMAVAFKAYAIRPYKCTNSKLKTFSKHRDN